MITISIDYDKLKEALTTNPSIIQTTDKGKRFLNLILQESPEAKYGNTHFVAISVSKEERAAGKKGAIIGNGKSYDKPQERQKFTPQGNNAGSSQNDSQDLPF